MPVICDEDQERFSIGLEAEVDIRCAAELKATLMDAIASRKEVQLDFERATDLDVTAVQLLWAAARAVEQTGVRFAFAGESRETLTRAAREMGLDFSPAGSIDTVAGRAAVATTESAG